MLSLLLIIECIGFVQGALLSFILIFIKRNHANKFLGISILCFTVILIIHFLDSSQIYIISRHGIIISITCLLLGPSLLFYLFSLIKKNWNFTFRHLLHFIPLLLFSVLYFILFYSRNSNWNLFKTIIQLSSYIQIFAYIFINIIYLLQYSKKLKDSFSSIEKINLKWLLILNCCFILVWIIALIIEFSAAISFDILWTIVTLYIFLIGYTGLTQPEIISQLTIPETKGVRSTGQYQKSPLTQSQVMVYYKKLIAFMENERPYLESTVSLPVLSKMMLMKTHYLSQIINQAGNSNFFDFINRYRILEAVRLLSSKKNNYKNISEIGFQVGYNSLSSFNIAFKKNMKQTPSQYRKKNFTI